MVRSALRGFTTKMAETLSSIDCLQYSKTLKYRETERRSVVGGIVVIAVLVIPLTYFVITSAINFGERAHSFVSQDWEELDQSRIYPIDPAQFLGFLLLSSQKEVIKDDSVVRFELQQVSYTHTAGIVVERVLNLTSCTNFAASTSASTNKYIQDGYCLSASSQADLQGSAGNDGARSIRLLVTPCLSASCSSLTSVQTTLSTATLHVFFLQPLAQAGAKEPFKMTLKEDKWMLAWNLHKVVRYTLTGVDAYDERQALLPPLTTPSRDTHLRVADSIVDITSPGSATNVSMQVELALSPYTSIISRVYVVNSVLLLFSQWGGFAIFVTGVLLIVRLFTKQAHDKEDNVWIRNFKRNKGAKTVDGYDLCAELSRLSRKVDRLNTPPSPLIKPLSRMQSASTTADIWGRANSFTCTSNSKSPQMTELPIPRILRSPDLLGTDGKPSEAFVKQNAALMLMQPKDEKRRTVSDVLFLPQPASPKALRGTRSTSFHSAPTSPKVDWSAELARTRMKKWSAPVPMSLCVLRQEEETSVTAGLEVPALCNNDISTSLPTAP